MQAILGTSDMLCTCERQAANCPGGAMLSLFFVFVFPLSAGVQPCETQLPQKGCVCVCGCVCVFQSGHWR